MGSECELKIRAISDKPFSIMLRDESGAKQEFDCIKGSVHELRFHFENKYDISFLSDVPLHFGILTVNSVSDFCWMVLNLATYFKKEIEIIDARPNPILMIKNVI